LSRFHCITPFRSLFSGSRTVTESTLSSSIHILSATSLIALYVKNDKRYYCNNTTTVAPHAPIVTHCHSLIFITNLQMSNFVMVCLRSLWSVCVYVDLLSPSAIPLSGIQDRIYFPFLSLFVMFRVSTVIYSAVIHSFESFPFLFSLMFLECVYACSINAFEADCGGRRSVGPLSRGKCAAWCCDACRVMAYVTSDRFFSLVRGSC
jgi:hypothetical protein